jgi:hypothetical protein
MKICRSPTFSAAKRENGRESFAARAPAEKLQKIVCGRTPSERDL